METNELKKIWKDQAEFNLNFQPKPEDFPTKSAQTKEMILHAFSELDELLRCVIWKNHRKKSPMENRAQIQNELTDILKYWISIALIWDISPEEALQDYWRKSMVCRQRYSEEFVKNLEGSFVILDLDGVLANYREGLLKWISFHYPVHMAKCEELNAQPDKWIGFETFEIAPEEWQAMKHHFRTSGGKITLEPYAYAKTLSNMAKQRGHKVAILTSRPIDEYPNIYSDTLQWLKKNEIHFDFIWWSRDKSESILSLGIKNRVVLAVEDDIRYALPMARIGIPTLFINRMSQSIEALYSTMLVVDEGNLLTEARVLYDMYNQKKKENQNENETSCAG